MNIKKYSLKTMCAALACTIVLSSTLAAYATDVIINETPMDDSVGINALSDDSSGTGSGDSGWTTEENSVEDIKVTYQQSSSYTVTIPKTIALDTNRQAAYSVKVSGDIDDNQRIYVAPVDGIADSENLDFYMKDLSNKKAEVVATVTQNKTYWNSEDVTAAYEETNNSVSAPDLTAGTWEGIFQMQIKLETQVTHKHNYVETITKEPTCTETGEKTYTCDCGDSYAEAIPATGHHYENGECTECGEKDPNQLFPIGDESDSSDWDYTLDEAEQTITLNYYIGNKTDVTVYGSYEVDGVVYKTRIKSNTSEANSNTPYMFNAYAQANCRDIKSIMFNKDIDTSNITNIRFMFGYCQSLVSLDLGNFDTSNVTDMSYMFWYCRLLNPDLNSFDTSNVTNMSAMFASCYSLTNPDLSSFDTSNVISMDNMFYYCGKLTELDLSSFDTNNVTNMSSMFNLCESLKTIYVTHGQWITNQANTTNMFKSCGTSKVTYK